MAMQMMKRSMSRMLKQSIVELCRSSVGAEGYVEIDGIVCITIGEEDSEEIVVKVHEILGDDDDDMGISVRRNAPPMPPRSAPPPIRLGRPPASQGMPNAQMSNKSSYSPSSMKQNIQGHPGGPTYTQAGHSRTNTSGGQYGGDPYKRQASTPTKAPQEAKKQQMMDNTVIKIEIESDDESTESTPEKGKGISRPGNVVCNVCEVGLPSVVALKQHVSEVHRASICEICWQPFATKAELEHHMKTHEKSQRNNGKADKKDSGQRFKCGVCGNTSDSHKVMVDHLRSGHEFQGCYTCMLCREYFPNKPTFTIHRKLSHPTAMDVTCQTCGVGLKQNEFENHRKECLGEGASSGGAAPQNKATKGKKKDIDADAPPAKRQCSDGAQSGRAAQAPIKPGAKKDGAVDKNKQFECQICCLLLDTFAAYDRHTTEVHKRFVCPVCAGTFKTNRAVQHHMTRHTSSLPFKCDKCGIGCQSEDEFKRHNFVSHNVGPGGYFTCTQCDVLLGSKPEFAHHMRELHKVDYLWEEEMEKYVIFEMDGDDEMYNDEDGEYMDEEGYDQNHGEFDSSQHYPGGHPGQHQGYDMEEEEGYDEDQEDDVGHEGTNMVTCNICELVVASVTALKDHIHTVHRAVVCEVCWRPFLTQLELDAHKKVHQAEAGQPPKKGANANAKDIKAPSKSGPGTSRSSAAPSPSASPAAARQSSSSSASSNKTTMSFKCGVCGSASDGRKGMVEHLKSAHEYLGCYTCLLCGEFFPNKPTFTIHRKLSHSTANEMTCQSCGVGLMEHEFDQHIEECESGGINIKDAEWEGKKEIKKEKQ